MLGACLNLDMVMTDAEISWSCSSYVSCQVRLKMQLILCNYIFNYVNTYKIT